MRHCSDQSFVFIVNEPVRSRVRVSLAKCSLCYLWGSDKVGGWVGMLIIIIQHLYSAIMSYADTEAQC